MAQSLEEIKASFEAPTHREVVNGVQVDLTAEEVEATLNYLGRKRKSQTA